MEWWEEPSMMMARPPQHHTPEDDYSLQGQSTRETTAGGQESGMALALHALCVLTSCPGA